MDKTMENPLCEWSVVVGRGDMPLRQGPHLSLLSAFCCLRDDAACHCCGGQMARIGSRRNLNVT